MQACCGPRTGCAVCGWGPAVPFLWVLFLSGSHELWLFLLESPRTRACPAQARVVGSTGEHPPVELWHPVTLSMHRVCSSGHPACSVGGPEARALTPDAGKTAKPSRSPGPRGLTAQRPPGRCVDIPCGGFDARCQADVESRAQFSSSPAVRILGERRGQPGQCPGLGGTHPRLAASCGLTAALSRHSQLSAPLRVSEPSLSGLGWFCVPQTLMASKHSLHRARGPCSWGS